ncbi:hypothetical protein [Noviherbaspirillum aerium]|uniref:hypothetical protein n=1 Tax=Noviherbaspirillum aerium TaxID=2588497 RepID=UPI00124C323E|nr:hypothetical protein [Noviherbaspirillum aerium]
MTPDEIINSINTSNREILYGMEDYRHLTPEQVLALMDSAAMRGFKMGSNTALSMIQGAIAVQLARSTGARPDIGEL